MAISVFVCFANLKFYYFCESESHLCSLLKSVAPLDLPYILYCILFSLSDKIASCYKKRHRNRQYNHIIRNTNIPAIRNYNALFIDGLKASPLYIAFMIMHPIIRIAIAEDTISISFTGT